MTTYAISQGVDPNQMRVAATEDNFGAFETEEDAARRLLAIVDGRLAELRRSKAHARRILRAASKTRGGEK